MSDFCCRRKFKFIEEELFVIYLAILMIFFCILSLSLSKFYLEVLFVEKLSIKMKLELITFLIKY